MKSEKNICRGFNNSLSLVLPKQSRVGFSGPFTTTALVDLNAVDGGAQVFTAETIDWRSLHGTAIQSNWSQEADRWLSRIGGKSSDLLNYVLATTHSPSYIEFNVGPLERDWPRIPLPATAELLSHSAALGRRLAELLDPESDVRLQAEWGFLARLQLPPELPEGAPDRDGRDAARLAVTAGWGGRGQGETVMPRRGKAPERGWTATELERLRTLAGLQELSPEAALELLGARCVDVYLNGNTWWAAVPLRVWEYTLGGYQVLKKWLSYREEPLLGRPLHEEEARYFAQVVRRIAAILLMGPALDASYAAILPTATGLSAASALPASPGPPS